MPENIEAITIIDLYINFMIDGMGGPNFVAMKEILKSEGYENDKEMLFKIMIYVTAALSERRKPTTPVKVISKKSKDLVRAHE